MTPGYYRDLSNEAYHGGEGVSKTQLDLIAKAPALFQWNKGAPEDPTKPGLWISATLLTPTCLSLSASPRSTQSDPSATGAPMPGRRPGQSLKSSLENALHWSSSKADNSA